MANTTGMKFGGREKGTPNRLTKELRTILKNVLYNELDNIEELLDSLEPKERLELVIKLIPENIDQNTRVMLANFGKED